MIGSRHVINDTTGAFVIEFFDDGHARMPVLGWIVEVTARHGEQGWWPEPVIYAEGLSETYCVEMKEPSGTVWVFPGDCSFTSLDEAIAHGSAAHREVIARRLPLSTDHDTAVPHESRDNVG